MQSPVWRKTFFDPIARILLYRAGITYCCVVTLLLYGVKCLWVDAQLPAGNSIFQPPILDGSLIVFMIICSYLFFAWGRYLKRPFCRDYTWCFAVSIFFYLVLSTFCFVKSVIPFFVPYYCDPFLQRLDLFLYFGHTPFELLAPWFTPGMYAFLDKFYDLAWFLLMDAYVFWQIFTRRPAIGRIHFLSSFLMSWILLGDVVAVLFSSVGPIFYSAFYHDAYTPLNQTLVQHLKDIDAITPLQNMKYHDLLLGWYRDNVLVHKNIMSAMPSMHNGVAFLLLLHSWRYARPLLIITIPFCVCIFIGSIMLGWHYSVDTYVADLGVFLIWWVNGKELKKCHGLDHPPAPAQVAA